MNVWLVTPGEPLPIDAGRARLLRTGVLAGVLTGRAHAVRWWTSAFDHSAKQMRRSADIVAVDGFEIRLLRGCGYRSNVSPWRLVDHELIARQFRAAAAALPAPDVIVCSYPTIELARETVRYGSARGVPVLLDIRDLWPDLMIDLLPSPLRPAGRAALWWLTSQGRTALTRCTGILAVSDRYLEWGLAMAGRGRRDSDGVFPLSYPEREVDGASSGARLLAAGVDPDKIVVWFVGSFGRTYDLATVIRAAAQLPDRIASQVQFVFSGAGDQDARWRQLAADAAGAPVVFTGWIDADEIAWLRAHAAIGLQPYAAGAPQGLANKLFEYISAGLPVLSSLQGENAAIIAEHDCGLTYRAGDAADFTAQLTGLVDDQPRRRRMGANGRQLFARRFSSDQVFPSLAMHLERVAGAAAPPIARASTSLPNQ